MHRLERIRRLLRLENFSDDKRREELKDYQDALDYSLDPVRSEPMYDQAFEHFETHEVYQAWLKARQPCLLVLSADNYAKNHVHCWLPPVAIKVIEKLHLASENISISYYLVSKTSERLIGDITGMILFQLLENNNQALREHKRYDELCAAIQQYRQFCDGRAREDDMAGSDRFSALETIVSRVLAFFNESETVYVIIDRLDLCYAEEKDHRKRLMRTLVRMVEEARCRLEALAVVDKADWAVEDYRDELDDHGRGRVIIHTAE